MLNIGVGIVALFLTFLIIILPWRLKIKIVPMLRKIFFFFLNKFSFFLNFISKRTEKNRSNIQPIEIEKEEEYFKNCESEEVSLMFSGGADSTLAAIKLIEKFKKVHLVTFDYSAVRGIQRAKEAGERLINKFGNYKLQHRIINIEDIFKEIYFDSFWKDFRRYKLFVENICAFCKIAMLFRLLIYNIDYRVKYAASGANRDAAPFFAEQMPKVSELIKELYLKYDKIYFTPVFNILRTDHELYNLGLSEEKDKKFPNPDFDEGQASCDFGLTHHIFAQGYFIPFYGHDKLVEISYNFVNEKIKYFEDFKNKYLEKNIKEA